MVIDNVALFIYARPETTLRVFETIRQAAPKRLFLIGDGPNVSRPKDTALVHETRRLVERGVDWDCELHTNYLDVNRGMGQRQASGFGWVLDQVESCIFLEDDTVPHSSFFPYCTELLGRYREDRRVMAISGNNFHRGMRRSDGSYYFSRMFHAWGWATWRRAWAMYDMKMGLWQRMRSERWLNEIWQDAKLAQYWQECFDAVGNGLDTWDYQFAFAMFAQNGVCIAPAVNLVSNIGFGSTATNTKEVTAEANTPVEEMPFPLDHPTFLIPDYKADSAEFALMCRTTAPRSAPWRALGEYIRAAKLKISHRK
jgi:hypothetical protein